MELPPFNKVLYTVVEMSQILYNSQCTYDESEKILTMLLNEMKQQRKELEYDEIDAYYSGVKSHDAGNSVITPLNHVNGYC